MVDPLVREIEKQPPAPRSLYGGACNGERCLLSMVENSRSRHDFVTPRHAGLTLPACLLACRGDP